MEAIIALLIIFGLVIVVGALSGLVALAKIRGLERRVAELAAGLETGPERAPANAAVSQRQDAPPPIAAASPEPVTQGAWSGGTSPKQTDDAPDTSPPPIPPAARPAARRAPGPNPAIGLAAQWLGANWVAVAAVASLALAGIYLVNYGIETGLLTPLLRVILALALGGALVAGGEVLRRRGGQTDLGLLAAILSTGGLVTLYAAVIGAHLLYALIGDVAAMAGLVAVSLLAMALGGRYAAFLSHFGILGATLAPWLVGGETDNALIMPAYCGVIMAVATAVGLYRGWWILVTWAGLLCLSLGLPAVLATDDAGVTRLLYLGWLICLGLLPVLRSPDAPISASGALLKGITRLGVRGAALPPVIPLSLVLLATELAVYVVVSVGDAVPDVLSGGGLLALSLVLAGATTRTGGARLTDLPAWPIAAVTLFILISNLAGTSQDWTLIGLAGATGILGVGYGLWQKAQTSAAAFAVALLPGLLFGGLEWTNPPGDRIGAFPWAFAILAAAGVMTVAATVAGRREGGRTQAGLFVISAGGLIALSLSVVLADAALTVALAATVVIAHLIDRRLDLPYVPGAVTIALAGLMTRLILYPGLPWAWEAEWGHMILAFASVAAACLATFAPIGAPTRPFVHEIARAAFSLLVPTFVALVIFRLEAGPSDWSGPSHWSAVLVGLGFVFSGNALWARATAGSWWQQASRVTGVLLLGFGSLMVLYGAFALSPLIQSSEAVLGPVILNSLAVTYLLPGLGLVWVATKAARRMHGAHGVATGLRYLGAAFCLVWAALVLRHFWHGAVLTAPMVFAGEQYAYSALMLATGAVTLLLVAAPRIADGFGGQTVLRRVGLSILGLTIAKVFLVDASELTGLLRVVSLLILGLTLTGLTWIDRALSRRLAPGTDGRSTE